MSYIFHVDFFLGNKDSILVEFFLVVITEGIDLMLRVNALTELAFEAHFKDEGVLELAKPVPVCVDNSEREEPSVFNYPELRVNTAMFHVKSISNCHYLYRLATWLAGH